MALSDELKNFLQHVATDFTADEQSAAVDAVVAAAKALEDQVKAPA